MGDVKRATELNRSTWSSDNTLQWFGGYEGYSDPGEAAVFDHVASTAAATAILDIGVGAGRTTPLLEAIGSEYTAIDFSPQMVELCRTKYPSHDIRVGDARQLEFADNSFGLVVFSWNGIDAVDHEDRQLIFQEVRRVLRPDGTFIFSTHNKNGPGHNEKPWSFRYDDLKHPRRLLDSLRHLRTNTNNYRKNSAMNQDFGGWSMMNAAAHNFGIVIHYTTLEQQRKELDEAGFETPTIFDSRGKQIHPDTASSTAWWFHFATQPKESSSIP